MQLFQPECASDDSIQSSDKDNVQLNNLFHYINVESDNLIDDNDEQLSDISDQNNNESILWENRFST